jgi:hypothetical protein
VNPPRPTVSREEEALAEIAATRISRAGGWALTFALLATLAVGPLLELARALSGKATAFAGGAPIPGPRALVATWLRDGALAANAELRAGLLALEDRLGRESGVSAALRPAAQVALARGLGYGNSQVLVGKGGWLYYRTAFDYLTGRGFLEPRELDRRRTLGARYSVPEPDPVPGLLRLHDELEAKGIELVFFPVPVKAQVHPEPLVRLGRTPPAAGPDAPVEQGGAGPANPSFEELVRRLGAGGLPVYDALPDLRAAARDGEPLYFATDTHWNSRGMRVAAEGLARFLARETRLPQRPPAGLRRRTFAHETEGDLTRLLGAGPRGSIYPHERMELDEIVGLSDAPFSTAAASESDLLLVGDSYALVFTDLGGRNAGFGEQLAFALDRPVERVAKFASNNLADRVRWLSDEPRLLAGKRVVVYEVTARVLSSGDWTILPLEPRREARSSP